MDQTDTAVMIGIPLGIATATTALLKWTSFPKRASILGGIIGGSIVGIFYAAVIFVLLSLLERGAQKRNK